MRNRKKNRKQTNVHNDATKRKMKNMICRRNRKHGMRKVKCEQKGKRKVKCWKKVESEKIGEKVEME